MKKNAHIDVQYGELVGEILQSPKKENRTGINTYATACWAIRHDMADGFPLLTTKKMGMKNISAELECFIKGFSSKKEFHDRKCFIWDEWCNPQKVPYGNDEASKAKMMAEDDLGRIYGVQWRDWKKYVKDEATGLYKQESIDQLKNAIDILKNDPFGSPGRRIMVNAWNPAELNQMALPPCHYAFQLIVTLNHQGEKVLNLEWNQRSVDTMLGLPYNIASYALLLLLLAKEVAMVPGILMGTLGDVHVYENHITNAKEQISREPYKLPTLEITNFTSIWDWEYTDFELVGYESHPKVDYKIAV
ncbi:MAG: thymidylate synthase [uncultured bacterium (gcode 4)]|uniref:Thymidylate synthase n=1 Tax=uncultured bacterium (gcode 4) TaxID=1234023 RepID=K1XJA6_9BACT|nr:MAG: thymidylate synthase [uncultured bacterium (gcode 4)]HBB04495.1 thymidylate synthase [Candidatus Gracilibacteria bacterium]